MYTNSEDADMRSHLTFSQQEVPSLKPRRGGSGPYQDRRPGQARGGECGGGGLEQWSRDGMEKSGSFREEEAE